MKRTRIAVHLSTIRRRYKDKVYECHLLRRTFREGKKVRHETVANLSALPPEVIEVIRMALSGRKMVPVDEAFEPLKSLPTGHVRAVLGVMKNLGVEELLSSRACRERDLVMGMIAERIVHPASKLGTVRLWKTTTLARDLGVEDARVEELYGALEWLLKRQGRVEQKLAGRHLTEGGLALYDTSNCHYEGQTCGLGRVGKDKDGRHGASVIAFGVLADREGRPVGIEVYPGDTGDPATVTEQLVKIRARFGLKEVVLVGDRGMLTKVRIESLKAHAGLGWITALRSEAIRALVDAGALQLSLFDERNLAEIVSPEFPGERLVACYNPYLAEERKRKREELLQATERLLSKVAREVARRTKKPMREGEIGQKVGRVLHRYKMAKHFEVEVRDGFLSWRRKEEAIHREAELDGIYVLRTSEPEERLSAKDTVRSYKRLGELEQAFRCLKGMDLKVRPVFLRDEDHVRAHFFLCMLAYYVEWHMRRALAPLLFEDEAVPVERDRRDPVAKPEPSRSVKAKKATRKTPEGLEVHSFDTLLADLATQAQVTSRVAGTQVTFDQVTPPTPLQRRAFDLLGVV